MRAAWPSASLWNSSMISWHLNCSVTAQTLYRRIIHIDMDAFYASVESRDDPSLRGKPLAVGGAPQSRGVVMAANYEARAFGVRSAIPMARAVRLCPQLAIVRPDFARYKAVSQQVMAILRSCTPLVEPLSVDEAYLDVTENLWGEPLATNIAKRIKERIRDELGLTASAGVAPNKFLAKIASGWQKPDGLTVIAPERVEQFLQQLPVETLWGVGPVTAKKLRAVGIARLVDVRAADRELLARTVSIKVRYANFTTVTRSHTAEDSTNSEKYIVACARALLERTDAAHRPVRLLGVGAHGLEREGDGYPESERLF